MKKEKKKNNAINIFAAVAVLLVSCLYLAGSAGYDRLVMFRDVTVELGTPSLSIREFMTPAAWGSQVDFVTDHTKVDLGKVGQTEITLSHGGKEQTVLLTVQDTKAPTADIEAGRTVEIDAVPEAWELVSNVQDAAPVTIYYAQEPVVSVDYSDVTVTVVVEDSSGNKLEGDCTFSYRWLRESLTLELGDVLTADMLLLNPRRDGGLLDKAQINRVNNSGVGEYVITAALNGREASCTITVEDTRGPELEVQDVTRRPGGYVTLKDYIVSAEDPSGVAEVRMVGEAPDNMETGRHTVIIEAEDGRGNVTRKEAQLWIATDTSSPRIQGATEPMTIEKYSQPDFLEGVTAYDKKDGQVEVTVDTSKLDVTTAGIYYITYIARDSSGNADTIRRKVEVLHDEEDTAAMVKRIADTLPNDVEEIRDYVRSTIGYSSNWGGDDPIWYGFTKNGGNCYVHAHCLQAILEYKGYETQLIWVTNESHYWLIVKLGDVWRHIDATPSPQHAKISLMTDDQRLSTLSGRLWDFEKWPACE